MLTSELCNRSARHGAWILVPAGVQSTRPSLDARPCKRDLVAHSSPLRDLFKVHQKPTCRDQRRLSSAVARDRGASHTGGASAGNNGAVSGGIHGQLSRKQGAQSVIRRQRKVPRSPGEGSDKDTPSDAGMQVEQEGAWGIDAGASDEEGLEVQAPEEPKFLCSKAKAAENGSDAAKEVDSSAKGWLPPLMNSLLGEKEEEESEDENEDGAFLGDGSLFGGGGGAARLKGRKGLANVRIKTSESSLIANLQGLYVLALKVPSSQFFVGTFLAPVALSLVFTLFYLVDVSGLVLDGLPLGQSAPSWAGVGKGEEEIGEMLKALVTPPESEPAVQASQVWTVFQVFMFSLSLATSLQPEVVPTSPYALVLANVNALIAQLIFVFLSGAVFARLAQPARPIKCSKVAVISPFQLQGEATAKKRQEKYFLCRLVLTGPEPSELIDTKLDLTYEYDRRTRSGQHFRETRSLPLVRSEIAQLKYGLMIRHLIDASSPLFQRTEEELLAEDAHFTLSVVGLERSSMQSVFHSQLYCVADGDVVWDAEFAEIVTIDRKGVKIIDQTKLDKFRYLDPEVTGGSHVILGGLRKPVALDNG